MSRTPDFRKNRNLIEVIVEGRRPGRAAETGWWKVGATSGDGGYGILFENSWNNVGASSNAPASWYLSEDGEVRLRGKISGGSVGSTAFTLPEEARPEYAETFICSVDGGGYASVTVWPDGRVVVDSVTAP
jgi:hypothetical protein